jgi:hypothetical protein
MNKIGLPSISMTHFSFLRCPCQMSLIPNHTLTQYKEMLEWNSH